MGNKGVLKQQIQTNVRTIISIAAMVVLAAFVAASVQVQHAHAATANTLKVSITGKFFKKIVLVDKEPALRDAKVVVADIKASNGIAHGIDRVLLPVALISAT